MKRSQKWWIVLVIAGLGFLFWGVNLQTLPQEKQDKPAKKIAPLGEVLPEKILVYVALNDFPTTKERFKETVDYKVVEYFIQKGGDFLKGIWALRKLRAPDKEEKNSDEEEGEEERKEKQQDDLERLKKQFEEVKKKLEKMKGFEKDAKEFEEMEKELERWEEELKELKKRKEGTDGPWELLGRLYKEFMDLLDGEIAVAIWDVDIEEEHVDLLLKIDINDLQKGEQILKKILKVEELEKAPSYKMENPEVTIYKPEPKEEKGFCCTLYEGCILLGTKKTSLENAIKGLARIVKLPKTLVGHPAYQKIFNTKVGNPAFTFLLNFEAISDLVAEKGKKDENVVVFRLILKSFFKTLGVDTLKALGLSVGIKEGKYYETTYLYGPGEKKELLKAMALPRLTDPEGIIIQREMDTYALDLFLGGSLLALKAKK